jgi:hypothetical protein
VLWLGRQKTREEIRTLIAEGWRFRKKARKGKLYISARKKGKETSLGAFNQEYWAIIEATIKDPNTNQSGSEITKTIKTPKVEEDPWLKTFEEISRKMNQNAGIKCLHVQNEGFCDYWRLENLPAQATELEDKDVKFLFNECNTDSEKFWLFRAFPILCMHCQTYIDEVAMNFVNTYKKNTNKKIKGHYISFKTIAK